MVRVFKGKNIDDIFYQACHMLWFNPEFVASPRGQYTRELLNVVFVLGRPQDRLIQHPARALNIGYFCGEFLWYQRASGNVDEISYYSKFWENLVDKHGKVASCYGQRIFCGGRWSQWAKCRELLSNDPDTRRAVLIINTPEDQKSSSLDIPCTNTLQFFIRERKLYLTVHMRSNDLVWGVCYDVPIFTLWQEIMLVELQALGVPVDGLGSYTHFASSLHSYMRHENIISGVAENGLISGETDKIMPKVDESFLAEVNNLMLFEKHFRRLVEKEIKNNIKKNVNELVNDTCKEIKISLKSDLSRWIINYLIKHAHEKMIKS